jgi:hypothetical protein
MSDPYIPPEDRIDVIGRLAARLNDDGQESLREKAGGGAEDIGKNDPLQPIEKSDPLQPSEKFDKEIAKEQEEQQEAKLEAEIAARKEEKDEKDDKENKEDKEIKEAKEVDDIETDPGVLPPDGPSPAEPDRDHPDRPVM